MQGLKKFLYPLRDSEHFIKIQWKDDLWFKAKNLFYCLIGFYIKLHIILVKLQFVMLWQIIIQLDLTLTEMPMHRRYWRFLKKGPRGMDHVLFMKTDGHFITNQ